MVLLWVCFIYLLFCVNLSIRLFLMKHVIVCLLLASCVAFVFNDVSYQNPLLPELKYIYDWAKLVMCNFR